PPHWWRQPPACGTALRCYQIGCCHDDSFFEHLSYEAVLPSGGICQGIWDQPPSAATMSCNQSVASVTAAPPVSLAPPSSKRSVGMVGKSTPANGGVAGGTGAPLPFHQFMPSTPPMAWLQPSQAPIGPTPWLA